MTNIYKIYFYIIFILIKKNKYFIIIKHLHCAKIYEIILFVEPDTINIDFLFSFI